MSLEETVGEVVAAYRRAHHDLADCPYGGDPFGRTCAEVLGEVVRVAVEAGVNASRYRFASLGKVERTAASLCREGAVSVRVRVEEDGLVVHDVNLSERGREKVREIKRERLN